MRIFTIPNIITLFNLICGCIGILCVFNNQLIDASILIFVALVLDFADGFVARKFNMFSDIGKQLDSLADMVTFGVLPSMILYYYIDLFGGGNWKYAAFILAMFSALRLAKFNIDIRQSDSFIGVPTPANAMVVASVPFLLLEVNWVSDLIKNPWVFVVYSLVFSYLLIMELPLMAFKFKNFKWADNKIKFIFTIISVFLLLIFKIAAIPIIIFLYILISILNNINKKA